MQINVKNNGLQQEIFQKQILWRFAAEEQGLVDLQQAGLHSHKNLTDKNIQHSY